MEQFTSLLIPSFVAGVLTFLAPCTLPLVPGYLMFISGISIKDLQDPAMVAKARQRVLGNALLYVLGFSVVFIILGSVFSLAGSVLVAHRIWLMRIGGVFITFFGLYLMHVFKFVSFSFLDTSTTIGGRVMAKLQPGKPISSLLFGMTFAFGWTPCVGPILGTILLLASTAGQAGQGALLLVVFSIGLAAPFLLLAFFVAHAIYIVRRLHKYLKLISIISGIFLVVLGMLLIFNHLADFFAWFLHLFPFLNLESAVLNKL